MIPKKYRRSFVAILLLAALACSFAALNFGSIDIPPGEILSICLGSLASLLGLDDPAPEKATIILQLR